MGVLFAFTCLYSFYILVFSSCSSIGVGLIPGLQHNRCLSSISSILHFLFSALPFNSVLGAIDCMILRCYHCFRVPLWHHPSFPSKVLLLIALSLEDI